MQFDRYIFKFKTSFLPCFVWWMGIHMIGMGQYLFSQEIPAIVTYNRDQYLGGNKNWGFAEDDEGNLYVANTKGVMIFNGLNWQMVFLPNHRVPRSIYCGFDGRIYVGGFETIGYIDRSDPNKPEFVTIGQEILNGSEEEIWHITGNENQLLFQSFAIIIFSDGETMELYQPNDNIMYGHWEKDRLWIPRIKSGLFVFENGIERSINPRHFPKEAVITGLENYGQDQLIIATRNQGLYFLKDSVAFPVPGELNDQLKEDQINEMILLSNGDYAIGTIQNGVYITEDFSKMKYHVNKSNGLANNTVLSLYEARTGGLCIGLDIGMNILMIQEPDLFFYDVEGKLGTVFASIYYHNKFFIGTNQGVFVQDEQGQFTIVPGSQGQVWSLKVVGEDLLCGHNSGTLQWMDGEFEVVSPITGGLHMQLLSDDQLLQSTYNGLILLENRNGLWQDIRRISGTDKLVDRFVYRSGEVVGLHPYFGLVYYKLDLRRYSMVYRKIFQNQELKIGTNALGLLLFQDKILVQVDTSLYEMGEYGTLERTTASLQKDFQQKVKGNLEYQILKPINNNAEKNRLISYFPDKNLIIQSIDEGYQKHFINKNDHQNNFSRLSLDYLLVNNRVYPISAHDMEFSPSEKNLTFQLGIADGFLSEEGGAEYRLIPYGNSWNMLPGDGKLEFKQLNHGTYHLQVRQGDGIPDELLTFAIHPWWYESWPGLLLFLLLCGLLTLYVNRKNNNRLQKEKEKMMKEKEAALEAERIRAKAEKLEHEVSYKSKMLANSAITMVQKNKMLNELKAVIKKESSNSVQAVKSKAIKLIDRNLNSDESWEIFDRNFAEVHEDFIERFKDAYPAITSGDLRLAAYIRMNMSSKEIAPVLQISVRSVENKRYRLRKKMNLSSDTNLSEYLMRF